MLLHSVNSVHTASLEAVITRTGDIIKCGELLTSTFIGSTNIAQYKLGNNVYIITMVNSTLVALELKDVYCFRTQL